MESKLSHLVYKKIQEVRVVEDYLQLVFINNSVLNIYNSYRYNGECISSIKTQEIISINENNEQITLSFSNKFCLIISLKDDDYKSPEAIELIKKGKETIIWN